MADEKLTELPVVAVPLLGPDQLYLVREGVSYQTTLDDILAVIPPVTPNWGSITGAITNQTDLQDEFATKADAGSVVGGGLTMNADRILGRIGGGVGDITEITIGAGLLLSGGELSATGGAAVWGSITGTLSDQTDLQAALDAKLSGVAWGIITGTLSDQTDLQAALDAKLSSVSWGMIGGMLSSQTDLNAALGLKAPLASPTFTGTPAAPTAAPGTNTTQIATTAFVLANSGTGTVTSVSSANGDLTVSSPSPTPVLTVVSAPKWSTARNLAGNSVDGSGNVAFANKFVVQGTTDSGLPAAQFLGALGTGIVKNTTTTGVLSIAIAADFPTLNQNTSGSAATLTTPRAINGVNFDGSAAITITAAAGTLTGTTLNATVVTSTLTTVGALASGSLATGFVVGGVTMTLGSDAANDLYYRNGSGVLTRLANGTTGQFLAATTASAPSWGTPSGSGTVTHTGSLTSNAVVLGNASADITVVAGITTDGTSALILGVNTTTLGKVKMFGNTSGDVTIQPNAVAGTGIVLTLPATTTTLVGLSTTDTLTNKTLTSPVLNGLTSSGSTSIDFSGNSGTTKLTTGATTLGSSATVNGVILAPEIQQNIQSSAYTLVLSDANKQIYNSGSGTQTWTIPANSSVAFPIGTTIVFCNTQAATRNIAITTDTLTFLPSLGSGTRTLAGGGLATAMKVTSTAWVITGVGIT